MFAFYPVTARRDAVELEAADAGLDHLLVRPVFSLMIKKKSKIILSLYRATSISEVNGFSSMLATFASNNIASANELKSLMKVQQP